MQLRQLGKTGIDISEIALGAGPVSELMVGLDHPQQLATVSQASEMGINWVDTAATYGNGASEKTLGRACSPIHHPQVHVATKIRLSADELDDPVRAIRSSLHDSLSRLNRTRVTLLQLHNSITCNRGDLPTSVTPNDVLRSGGIAAIFEQLRQEGLVDHFGLTGLGDSVSLESVIRQGPFETIQIPWHLLIPLSGSDCHAGSIDVDYGRLLDLCKQTDMAALVIRVFAGGAITGKPPSRHTHRTPFFPLDLYQRDQQRSEQLKRVFPAELSLKEAAVRFVLGHEAVSSAIIGFANPEEVIEVCHYASKGPLDEELLSRWPQALPD